MDIGMTGMVPWWWLLVFFVLGGIFGVMVMCLMFAAKRADEVMIRNVKYHQLNGPGKKPEYALMKDGLGVDE